MTKGQIIQYGNKPVEFVELTTLVVAGRKIPHAKFKRADGSYFHVPEGEYLKIATLAEKKA